MNQIKMLNLFPKLLLSDPNPNRRYYLFIIIFPSLFLLIFFSFSFSSSFLTIPPIKTLFSIPYHHKLPPITPLDSNKTELYRLKKQKLDELNRSKIAICLVGGARRFELTGSSILKYVFKVYPNSDLFLHSPLDKDSFKFSLLKNSPSRIASIRIFQPKRLLETESQVRVLTSANSPNGIQGLLQYFNLVEGCLTMIKKHQIQNNFTYDWVVRTRVDGYWNAPLDPENFIPGYYLIPPGSNFGGLNDRLGIGDMNASTVALSRLSLIPELDSYGFTGLNSEAAFKAQLKTQGVKYHANRLPFCVLSDRKYSFPPTHSGVPVASLSSPGPLSGTKCRPCKHVCVGSCVSNVMQTLYKGHGWTNWENGAIELCDAHDEWETGWEKVFDQVAGTKFASVRRHIESLELTECIKDFEEMRRRTVDWDSVSATKICRLGLGS